MADSGVQQSGGQDVWSDDKTSGFLQACHNKDPLQIEFCTHDDPTPRFQVGRYRRIKDNATREVRHYIDGDTDGQERQIYPFQSDEDVIIIRLTRLNEDDDDDDDDSSVDRQNAGAKSNRAEGQLNAAGRINTTGANNTTPGLPRSGNTNLQVHQPIEETKADGTKTSIPQDGSQAVAAFAKHWRVAVIFEDKTGRLWGPYTFRRHLVGTYMPENIDLGPLYACPIFKDTRPPYTATFLYQHHVTYGTAKRLGFTGIDPFAPVTAFEAVRRRDGAAWLRAVKKVFGSACPDSGSTEEDLYPRAMIIIMEDFYTNFNALHEYFQTSAGNDHQFVRLALLQFVGSFEQVFFMILAILGNHPDGSGEASMSLCYRLWGEGKSYEEIARQVGKTALNEIAARVRARYNAERPPAPAPLPPPPPVLPPFRAQRQTFMAPPDRSYQRQQPDTRGYQRHQQPAYDDRQPMHQPSQTDGQAGPRYSGHPGQTAPPVLGQYPTDNLPRKPKRVGGWYYKQ